MAETQPEGQGGRYSWPWRAWPFWCGLLVGGGIGLLFAAAMVEVEVLTLRTKTWFSVLGCLLGSAGAVVALVAGRGQPPGPG